MLGHVNKLPIMKYCTRACHVMWLCGEAGQMCVNVLDYNTPARSGRRHIDTHPVQARHHLSGLLQGRQGVLSGRFPKTAGVMQCHMTSYHDSACGDCCLTHHLEPLCRTTGSLTRAAALTWMKWNTVSDVNRLNFWRALICESESVTS